MIKRGTIVLAHLRGATGHEQKGKRPVLVVQNDVGNRFSPTTIVVPVSQKAPRLPTHVPIVGCGLDKPSVALCEQIRTLDRRRFVRVLGHADPATMARVDEAVEVSLGLRPLAKAIQ